MKFKKAKFKKRTKFNKSNIKKDSFKEFIITYFPKNLYQCVLLENYLTGYIDPMPKAKKDFVLDSLPNILDIQYKP